MTMGVPLIEVVLDAQSYNLGNPHFISRVYACGAEILIAEQLLLGDRRLCFK
jgi:hypothetical protein